ncbi:MAG: antibiotic biosynthesis monooxygenase [Halioglobus sp.]
MIIVTAKLTFTSQEDRDRAIEISIPIQQATRDQEVGCHAYCFSVDPCDPVAIQVYELWEDSDSLVAHFEHENYYAMVEVFSQVGFVESVNRAYLTERNEPVYGPDFEKKKSFFS